MNAPYSINEQEKLGLAFASAQSDQSLPFYQYSVSNLWEAKIGKLISLS